MEDRIKLSYFYGREADQYSFYRIPKLLFTEEYFKKISVEAKVLYGLMLDRMSLSMKNQWFDTEGRAYIYYSLEDIMRKNPFCSCSSMIFTINKPWMRWWLKALHSIMRS